MLHVLTAADHTRRVPRRFSSAAGDSTSRRLAGSSSSANGSAKLDDKKPESGGKAAEKRKSLDNYVAADKTDTPAPAPRPSTGVRVHDILERLKSTIGSASSGSSSKANNSPHSPVRPQHASANKPALQPVPSDVDSRGRCFSVIIEVEKGSLKATTKTT